MLVNNTRVGFRVFLKKFFVIKDNFNFANIYGIVAMIKNSVNDTKRIIFNLDSIIVYLFSKVTFSIKLFKN